MGTGYTSDLQRVAYHEAGHVLLLLNSKRSFKFVTINPIGGYNGRVFGVENYHNEAYAVDNALIASAGMVAEKMKLDAFRDPEYKETSDVGVLDKMIKHAYGPENVAFGYKEIIQAANFILKTRWTTVEKIAAALLERKTLTFNELNQLLKT